MTQVVFKDLIAKASGPGSKVSLKGIYKHGDGFIVRYTVRYPHHGVNGDPEYRVCVINSRGHFAGTMLVQ